jgi:AraC-like DNA-binding protein
MDFCSQHEAGFSDLILRIDTNALQNILTALVGWPVNRKIEFQARSTFSNPRLSYLRRLIDFAVGQLDDGPDNLLDSAQAELQQLLMVSFLFANPHNYSHLLESKPSDAIRWQVRAAEDYIEANWNQPIYIEEIAKVTGASARSLFQAFRDARGCSPMNFVKSIRLLHARQFFQTPDETTTVTSVGYSCGFQNMGHFARSYQKAFGELPSATLASAKRSKLFR